MVCDESVWGLCSLGGQMCSLRHMKRTRKGLMRAEMEHIGVNMNKTRTVGGSGGIQWRMNSLWHLVCVPVCLYFYKENIGGNWNSECLLRGPGELPGAPWPHPVSEACNITRPVGVRRNAKLWENLSSKSDPGVVSSELFELGKLFDLWRTLEVIVGLWLVPWVRADPLEGLWAELWHRLWFWKEGCHCSGVDCERSRGGAGLGALQ